MASSLAFLWFEVDEFDSRFSRATEMDAEIAGPRHWNRLSSGGPNLGDWLLGPDGYTDVLASPDGSAG